MRRRWSRGPLIAAGAAAAALALTGCMGGSALEPGTASDPPGASAEPSGGAIPATGAPTAPAWGADAPRPSGPDSCEPALLDLFGAERPQQGRIDDQVQVHGVVDMLFPTAPTCTISYVQGDQRWVIMAWFDEPETAAATIEGLEAQGWTSSETPTTGYVVTELTDGQGGDARVQVHPLSADERGVPVGQFPQGVDVTMVQVLLP